MSGLTKAELLWIHRFVENYDHVLGAYPELFDKDDEDDLAVVRQIIEEKLSE